MRIAGCTTLLVCGGMLTGLALVGVLRGLPAPGHLGAGASGASPKGRQAPAACVECHARPDGDPGLVAQWRASVHFAEHVGCADCHGTDHDAILGADGAVSPAVCAKCHAGAVQEFGHSLHAEAERRIAGHPLATLHGDAGRALGCAACHDIGHVHADGTAGNCQYCHTGHRFSAAEARAPSACKTCHSGPTHPQVEAYEASKHGIAFAHGQDPALAPTCQTCHMPKGSHDTSRGLTLGHVDAGGTLDPAPPVEMRILSRETVATERAHMVAICSACHADSFVKRNLAFADDLKREVDDRIGEARAIIESLYREGLLRPMPEDRAPHPTAGPRLDLGHAIYGQVSRIETQFFTLVREAGATTWKGAYHNSPDHVQWQGHARLMRLLDEIRGEAAALRAESRARGAGTPVATYVGPATCLECHKVEHASWDGTRMAHAFDLLKAGVRPEAKRRVGLNPDQDYTTTERCIECHVTGWKRPGGYTHASETPGLQGVTCEACHGPGSAYVEVMRGIKNGIRPNRWDDLVSAGLEIPRDATACTKCHDARRTPFVDPTETFDYAARRARGVHAVDPARKPR